MRRSYQSGFTLAELLVGMAIGSVVLLSVAAFTFASARLVARNLAVNFGHTSVRLGHQRLGYELHQTFSTYRLIDCTANTTFSDVNAVSTATVDESSGANLSTSASGVRFRTLAGGPYKLAENAAATATSLKFTTAGAENTTYVPEVGDLLYLPLIRKQLTITAVTDTTDPQFTVTVSSPIGYAFSSTTTRDTVAYFTRKVAFSVFNNELRFHRRYPGTQADIVSVSRGVTTQKPFALLCPGGGASDETQLRVTMEAYDTSMSARMFQGGAITLQTTYLPRTAAALLVQPD